MPKADNQHGHGTRACIVTSPFSAQDVLQYHYEHDNGARACTGSSTSCNQDSYCRTVMILMAELADVGACSGATTMMTGSRRHQDERSETSFSSHVSLDR